MNRNGTKPSFQACRGPPVETIGRTVALDGTVANRLQGQKAIQKQGTSLMISRCNCTALRVETAFLVRWTGGLHEPAPCAAQEAKF